MKKKRKAKGETVFNWTLERRRPGKRTILLADTRYDRGFSDGWDAAMEHVEGILEGIEGCCEFGKLSPGESWAIYCLRDLLRGEP